MIIRTTRPTALLSLILLTASAVAAPMLLAPQSAQAQAGALPRSNEEFEKQIGLTADQKAKLTAINQKYAQKMKPIADKYRPGFDDLQKKFNADMAALRAKYQPQFTALQQKASVEVGPLKAQQQKEADAVLTPAQREKAKKIMAAMVAQQRAQAQTMQQAPPPKR